MAIRKKSIEKYQIDIDGPRGNAWALLGAARDLGKQLGFSETFQTRISEEMKSGDYINLLKVFNKYFGDYVDLVTDNEDYLEVLAKEED